MSFLKKEDVIGKLVIDTEAKIIGTVINVTMGTTEEGTTLIVQCVIKTLKKQLKPDHAKLYAMLLEDVKKKHTTYATPEWRLAKDISKALNVSFQDALTGDNLVAYARAIGFEIPFLEIEKKAEATMTIPESNIAIVKDVILTKTPIELPVMLTTEEKVRICPSCEYQNPSYAKNFCIKCGAKLG